MRRLRNVIVMLFLIISITACSSTADVETTENVTHDEQRKEVPPEGFTEELFNLGWEAYAYMVIYENGDLDTDECYIRLKTIYEKAKAINEDPDQPREVQLNAIGVAGYCLLFNKKLLSGEEDLREVSDSLGELIKKDEYLDLDTSKGYNTNEAI